MIEEYKENTVYKIFCSNSDLDGAILNVHADAWVKYNDYTDVWYASKPNQKISVLKNAVKNVAPDILFINGIYSWYFNMVPLLFCKALKKIISVRGMLHPGALSQKKNKKKFYLTAWKILGLQYKCAFHASTEKEKEFIKQTFGDKIRVFVASNFPRTLRKQPPPAKKINELRMATVALISPMKNHLLVLQALQLSKANIQYDIYGPVKDDSYWQKCLSQVKNLPGNINVKYHGDIKPNEVGTVLSETHIFILPSKSENFGHAFFEALSAGKPVITSHNTPWQNLATSKAGINADPENISSLQDAILFFEGMGQDELNEWSAGAKKYSLNALNLEAIKMQYNNMFL